MAPLACAFRFGRPATARLDPVTPVAHDAGMNEPAPLAGPASLPAGGAPTSMVIFLHGYGSNGEDLMGLAPYWRPALPQTVFLAPNAPQDCPGAPGGYQWWALTDLSPQARAAGVRQSAPALNAYIDAQLARYGLSDDRLALVGFSQGTMMALHVGPRRTRSLAGIVGYSGMLADPEALAAEMMTRPPVLLVHGSADPTLPVVAMHHAKAALEALGFEVASHVSQGLGHSIDGDGLRLGEQFLARQLG
jgi:phospholipase/carboxylesterase